MRSVQEAQARVAEQERELRREASGRALAEAAQARRDSEEEQRRHAEAERIRREEAEEKIRREESDRLRREEALRVRREEAERVRREEAERIRREEAQREAERERHRRAEQTRDARVRELVATAERYEAEAQTAEYELHLLTEENAREEQTLAEAVELATRESRNCHDTVKAEKEKLRSLQEQHEEIARKIATSERDVAEAEISAEQAADHETEVTTKARDLLAKADSRREEAEERMRQTSEVATRARRVARAAAAGDFSLDTEHKGFIPAEDATENAAPATSPEGDWDYEKAFASLSDDDDTPQKASAAPEDDSDRPTAESQPSLFDDWSSFDDASGGTGNDSGGVGPRDGHATTAWPSGYTGSPDVPSAGAPGAETLAGDRETTQAFPQPRTPSPGTTDGAPSPSGATPSGAVSGPHGAAGDAWEADYGASGQPSGGPGGSSLRAEPVVEGRGGVEGRSFADFESAQPKGWDTPPGWDAPDRSPGAMQGLRSGGSAQAAHSLAAEASDRGSVLVAEPISDDLRVIHTPDPIEVSVVPDGPLTIPTVSDSPSALNGLAAGPVIEGEALSTVDSTRRSVDGVESVDESAPVTGAWAGLTAPLEEDADGARKARSSLSQPPRWDSPADEPAVVAERVSDDASTAPMASVVAVGTRGEASATSSDTAPVGTASVAPAPTTKRDEPAAVPPSAERAPAASLAATVPAAAGVADVAASSAPEAGLPSTPAPRGFPDVPKPAGAEPAAEGDEEIAGPLTRLAAFIVDGLVTTGVTAAVTFPVAQPVWSIGGRLFQGSLSPSGALAEASGSFVVGLVALLVGSLVVSFIYDVCCVKLRAGKTLGRMLLGLRVVPLDEGTVSWSSSMARWVVKHPLSGALMICFGLGLLNYAWCLWDRDRQCWHDKVGSTLVVYADES